MNVSLSQALERHVADQVESGLFNNASEVVRDALRLQQAHLLRLEALRREVEAGAASVRAGNVSRAQPDDIIRKAKARGTEA